ncbi:MAG: tetratricopeptide repeat protein [Deltaproteobacteria bacterium]|nr:tetratricopeptide repeat protein [Deltaproteobacteria bacterium]
MAPARVTASPSRGLRAAVAVLFLLSGTSGLIYQIVWVRQLGHVFGNTIHSAALVTAVFMCGLGAGGYVMGRLGDRRYRTDPRAPLRLYGYAELAIAVCGLLLGLLLPRLTALSAALSWYERNGAGWYVLSAGTQAGQYAVAIAALALPTFLMGGTLTLLIRYLVGAEIEQAGWRIGLLYGTNTAGAAWGALASDFALIPGLGIVRTGLVAVALGVVAGGAALLLARRRPAPAARTASPAPRPERAAGRARASTLALRSAAALCLSGCAAMGIEILWLRYLTQLLGALRAVFSLLLVVLMVGLWLGSTLGGYLHRRLGRPAETFVVAQCLLSLAVLVLLGLFDHDAILHRHLSEMEGRYFAATPGWQALLALGINLRAIAPVVALPALLMGLAFPLANAHAQRAAEAVGARAGLLYLGNTVGNVVGAVLTGFVLLPLWGIRTSGVLLGACAAAAALPLLLPACAQAHMRASVVAPSVLGAALGLVWFWRLPPERLLLPAIPRSDQGGTRIGLALSEGLTETLAVVEIPGVERGLYTNGHPMSATGSVAQRYMRAFAHLPLLQMDEPDAVLVICFGVGNTAHAASLHPTVRRLHVVDLSRHVLAHAGYFARANGGVLRDPRVRVFVDDGRHHLLMQPEESFDLVTLEPPPIAFAGVSALYSHELYELARSRLRPGGYVTQWLPVYQVPGDALLAMVRAFRDAFPESVLLSGDGREMILMGTRGPSITTDPDTVLRRMRARPAVQADLEAIQLGTPLELFGSFAAAASTMLAATRHVPALSDDRPLLEYAQPANMQRARIPAALFDVSGIDAWCPACRSEVPGLEAYLRVTGRIYRSGAFLRDDEQDGANFGGDAGARAAIDGSQYLKGLLAGPAYHVKRLGAAHLARGSVVAAIGAYRRAAYLSPGDADAHFELGVALARAGRRTEAEAELDRCLALSPQHPRANAVLCRRAAAEGRLDEARSRCARAEAGGVALSPELRQRLRPGQ